MQSGRTLQAHAGWLRRIARALVQDDAASEDVVQETLIALWRKPPPAGTPLAAWMRGLLHNFVRQHARRTHRWRRPARERETTTPPHESPETLLQEAQAQRRLAEALEQLEDPYRSTLILRYQRGLSAAEIARRHGVPASTVRWRVATGLGRLRAQLDEAFDGDRERWRRAFLPISTGSSGIHARMTAWLTTSGGMAVGAIALTVLAQLALPLAHSPRGSAGGGATTTPAMLPAGAASRHAGMPDPTPVDGAARPASFAPCPADWPLGAEVDALRPRLLVTGERLCALRAAIRREGSVLGALFHTFQARVDRGLLQEFHESRLAYARAHLATSAAFLYLVTGEARYARQAFEMARAFYVDPVNEPTPDQKYGLGRATSGRALALVYDWAYNGLTEPQRRFLADKLTLALDAWATYDVRWLREPHVSYWVSVCRGAELVQILALGAERSRAARYAELKRILGLHLRDAFSPAGASQEGIEKVGRAGMYLLPALYALRSVGDHALDPLLDQRQLWRTMMFAASFAPAGGSIRRAAWLASGVSPTLNEDAGFASLLFPSVPRAHVPHYRHVYDRHTGARVSAPLSQRFDAFEAGHVWALLYYPEEIPEADAGPALGPALADDVRGAYLFRSRFRDAGDVQVGLMGDFASKDDAWDTAEAFALHVRAHGATFAAGPERGSDPAQVSGLLVDGRAWHHRGDTGGPARFWRAPDGGYVRLAGGEKYQRLGLTSAERHLLVGFARAADASSLLATVDRLSADEDHTFTWQLNLGDHVGDGGLVASAGSEDGRPTFTVVAPGGGFLKGWVLSPAGAAVTPGDPLRIAARGRSVDLWVVMLVGHGTPPRARVKGADLGSVWTQSGRELRWNAAAQRMERLATTE